MNNTMEDLFGKGDEIFLPTEGKGNAGLGKELVKELAKKVLDHRNNFYKFFIGRYMEGLCSLFSYDIDPHIDVARLEIALRCGYGACFGKNNKDQNVLLGFVNDNFGFGTQSQLTQLIQYHRYNTDDIIYIIPESDRPKKIGYEIIETNNGVDGDFIVFHNKAISMTNDLDIVKHYATELAEIVTSRFSLIMQSKIMTIFTGDVNDETLNQLISMYYSGQPFAKATKLFDPEENIIHIDNPSLANNLQQLKTEYQNKIAELNAQFGINVLAVDKESGVTESEANGNLGYVNMNTNVFLKIRKQKLALFNQRFGTNYKVSINNDIASKLASEGGNTNENNNNDRGDNQESSET